MQYDLRSLDGELRRQRKNSKYLLAEGDMMKPNLVEVSCIDCGHIITLRPDQMEQHLEELCWEKKGTGWQCPHCYFFMNKEEGRDNRK